MFEEANLFWFGVLLEVGFIWLILKAVSPATQVVGERLGAKFYQLKYDYRRIQQELQEQKTQLSQECARLRQELQVQHEQLLKEHLQHQSQWQLREAQLTQEITRLTQLQQELAQQGATLTQERDRLQQELQQYESALIQERDRLLAELEAQRIDLIQERDRHQQIWENQQTVLLQQLDQLQITLEQVTTQPQANPSQTAQQWQHELEQQKLSLTDEFRQTTFQQLQTLLVNYPSASKIAHARPDLPAKNLTAMFTPLENLLQSWNYESIGPIWEQVAYDPQLHQPDAPDIQPNEPVYIRFVGYRHGDTILCPAKVSRVLPGGGSMGSGE